MPRRHFALSSLALASVLACRPEQATTTPTDPQPVAEVEAPPRPEVDVDAMLEAIKWLASDDLQGRFTLAPEIEQVAGWLTKQHESLGLQPLPGQGSVRVPYSLRTGVEAGPKAEQALQIIDLGKDGKPGKPKIVGEAEFIPRAEGSAGKAEAELVFVGYAARSNGEASDGGEPKLYDDLADVDVQGKIVLLLDQAPNTPDLIALFGGMQKIVEAFEAEAAPLRDKLAQSPGAEKDELAKLDQLHKKAREQIVDLVAPFVDTKQLGDVFWKVEDPKASIDMMVLGSALAAKRTGPQFDPSDNSLTAKLNRLSKAGAVGAIVVQGPRSFVGKAPRDADELPGVLGSDPSRLMGNESRAKVVPDPGPIPVVQLKWKQADKLFAIGGKKLSQIQAAIDADFTPRSQPLAKRATISTSFTEQRVEVPNVVGVLPGKTEEIVVLGAHFDHIGNDETGMCSKVVRKDVSDGICNGADDNASGTAMLLELARAYQALGVQPQRTIVFAHFSGEELGLLGSKALSADPSFPMDKVVAMVNLDMVGRLGPRGLAVGGIHTSADWMPLLDELGNYGMEILYEGATTTRSDHAWWFRKSIPVLFFFTGLHADYHRAGDHVDALTPEGLKSIGQMVADLVWALAGGREIRWSTPPEGAGIGRGLPGADPATVVKRVDAAGKVLDVQASADTPSGS